MGCVFEGTATRFMFHCLVTGLSSLEYVAINSRSFAALLDNLLDLSGASLSVDHNGEAFVIGEVGTSGKSLELLGSGELGVFLGDVGLLVSFSDSAGSGSSEDINSELGKSKTVHGVLNALEAGAVNEDGLLVADVNDDASLAVIFTVGNSADSADLNEVSVNLEGKIGVLERLKRREINVPLFL